MADDWLKNGIAGIQGPEAGDTLAESAFRRVQDERVKMGQSPEYPGEAKSIPHGLTYDVSQAIQRNPIMDFLGGGLGQYFQDLATEQPSGKPLDRRYIAAALDSPTGSIVEKAMTLGVPVWWLIKQMGRPGASDAGVAARFLPGQRGALGSRSLPEQQIDYSLIEDIQKGKNYTSVYPKNQATILKEEGKRVPGGLYINPRTGEDLTGTNPSAGIISINPKKGTGSLKIHPVTTKVVGSPDEKGATLIKTNLFKKIRGWKWVNAPPGYENVTDLISVYNRNKHYFTLETLFPKGVNLQTYPKEKSEPRLKPTVKKGFIKLGDVVGKAKIQGKERPVYDTITAFAKGGFVDKPLYERNF
tara:strand:+ start:447 stop:1520 length:1074 start_codon:yes stop_codon:yes gene_type:complete